MDDERDERDQPAGDDLGNDLGEDEGDGAEERPQPWAKTSKGDDD